MINVEEHFNLVHSVIHRHFSGSKLEYEDLYQQGCLGLVKAARLFDESKGFEFSTFAHHKVWGTIKTYLRDTQPIKMPRENQKASETCKVVCSLDALSTGAEGDERALADMIGYIDHNFEYIDFRDIVTSAVDTISNGFKHDCSRAVAREYLNSFIFRGVKLNQTALAEKYHTSQITISRVTLKARNRLKAILIDQGYEY